MNTTDWKYDFSSLPLWDLHQQRREAYDRFYELPQSDTLICIYSICEATMCNDLGRLAVLRNKQDPQLMAQCSYPFRVNFSASNDGNLIFLSPQIYDRASNRSKYPILILDIPNRRFSMKMINCPCPGFQVLQVKPRLFTIRTDPSQHDKQLQKLNGRHIRLSLRKWYDFSRLDDLHNLLF